MDAVNRKSRLLLMKYLLFTVLVITVTFILATFILVTFPGNSGGGYSIGISVDPKSFSILGLQLLSSIGVAYFIGPRIVNSIIEGQNWAYIGIKSLLICWTAPWIVISLIASMSDLTGNTLIFNILASIIPCFITGPIVGRALKKIVEK